MSDVLVVTEPRRGTLREVSYELLTAGRQVADAADGDLHVAVVSGPVDRYADSLAREGVDTIHTVGQGEEFNHDRYVTVIASLVNDLDPAFLLIPHSANGLDYGPAVSERLDRPVVTDAVALDVDDETLVANRRMYGSKIETVVEVGDGPFVVTVRAGAFPPAENFAEPEITAHDVTVDEEAFDSSVRGYEAASDGDVDITEPDFLIAVGRGIEDEENLSLVEDLAAATGATMAASRPVVDNGWLPKNRQVGQSGKTVKPTVYLALGISGAIQHVAGMRGAETVIAVNEDPAAPIFDVADYGVVGDLFEVVPRLIEQFG